MQGEFDFSSAPREDGLAAWRQQREQNRQELARRFGLPMGQVVEVWLRDGICLRGRLGFQDEPLFTTLQTLDALLQIDGTPFKLADLESCVLL